MIICQKLQSMPLLLGFWWVSCSLISSVLHFRTKRFQFFGHFVLGFSHAENVFTTRDCCRCNAASARDGNTTSVTESGAHECSSRHWGPAVWLSQCPLHPAPWLLACGNPCEGVGAVGQDWSGWPWSWAAGTAPWLRSWRHCPGVPVQWQMLRYFVEMGVKQGSCSSWGAAGDTWSIRGRPPWNVLMKIGEPANCFS